MIPVLLIIVLFPFLVVCNKTGNMWTEAGRMTGLLLSDCIEVGPQEHSLLILQRCLERRSLAALDRLLQRDVIEIANGIQLVRYRKENTTNAMVSESGRAIYLTQDTDETEGRDWKSQVFSRIKSVLNTFVVKLRLNGENSFLAEARRKRKDMMMPLMMFGMVAVGMIMIPMGFQFLAVLGGKALLLAKMALMLTSIQGLKRIAQSNVNYGLYSTGHGGPCKNTLSDCDWIDPYPWKGGDSEFVIDIDDTPQLNDHYNNDFNNFYLGFSGHYDRQWPYDAETHDVDSPYYYEVPDQQADLLHPRFDKFRKKYIE